MLGVDGKDKWLYLWGDGRGCKLNGVPSLACCPHRIVSHRIPK